MTSNRDPLTLHVLASGSSGNCAVIRSGAQSILLDAGLSARRIAERMEASGLDPHALSAIVITHEHSDHITGARVLSRRLGIPVFMTQGTARAGERHTDGVEVRVVTAGESVAIGSMGVSAFSVEHDAGEPVGYVFEDTAGARIGIVTDTGHLTAEAECALQDCDVLGVEFNHDIATLENGPYPWFLKQRILSSRGHMSNECAADAVSRLTGARLRHLVALHLSDTNNTAVMAERAMRAALDRLGAQASVEVCAQGSGPVRAGCE